MSWTSFRQAKAKAVVFQATFLTGRKLTKAEKARFVEAVAVAERITIQKLADEMRKPLPKTYTVPVKTRSVPIIYKTVGYVPAPKTAAKRRKKAKGHSGPRLVVDNTNTGSRP